MADEEDVALSAFDSFCRNAEEGRFPDLRDRDNLWKLLVTITVRKAIDLKVYNARQRRRAPDAASEEPDVEDILGREPSPDLAAQFADECRRLLDLLGEPG